VTTAQRASERSADEPESGDEVHLQGKLEQLLNASFKYMGVAELKQVCAACVWRGLAVQLAGRCGGGCARLALARRSCRRASLWATASP
jgi:hypothetical protein